ncbi:MAG: vitamin K epoxide reductase family protein [Chthoniobacterales bacterium]
MAKSKKKRNMPAPAKRKFSTPAFIYTIAAIICVAGIAESTYLTVAHLTGETVACGGSTGCSDVLGSKFAAVGPVPLAGLGGVAYFTAFSCAVLAAFGYLGARRFFAIAIGAMFLVTLWLLYVQAFVLHTFCRYCLVSAAMVFVLAALAVLSPSEA